MMVLIPGLNSFAYPPGGEYSDITVSHYPNAIYLRNAIMENHTIPLWSSSILSGYPFAANPLSGLWYPPGWMALLLPLPLGFNLLILLHLFWGGLGMYLLLRQEGISVSAALLGALAFEAMPKLLAHYGAGHISLVYAISWTPWLLYLYRVRVIEPVPLESRWKIWLFQPGMVMALVLLADVRWGFYAGVVWWGYAFAHSYHGLPGFRFWEKLKYLLIHSLIGFLLAAPLLLPFMEYTRLSTRIGMAADTRLIYSFPPERLLGMFFPDFGGFHEWMIYPGGVVIVLALIGWTWRRDKTDILFWQATVLLTVVLSFGAQFPGMEAVAAIPGMNLLRVPSRWLFITGIGFAALAAHCMERIRNGLDSRSIKRFNLGMVAILMLVVLWFVGVWILTREITTAYLWGVLVIFITAVSIYLLINGRLSFAIGVTVLISIGILDLAVTNLTLLESKNVEAVLSEAKAEASLISESRGLFRIYSPSYSIPQHIAAINEFQLANGVDPMQLSSYAEYLEKASGVPSTGYSVVLPPISDGDPKTANSIYKPNPFLLGLLNVKYVDSSFPLQVDGLDEVQVFDGSILYENQEMKARIWVQLLNDPSGQIISPVEFRSYQTNSIELEASGPGLLVLSEIYYPGWKVWVDEVPQEIKPYMGILRSVSLSSGAHEVRFSYIPASLIVGLIFWGLGITLLILEVRRANR